VVRDVTVYADDPTQVASIMTAMEHNSGTQILAVRDEDLDLHQQDKIAIRIRVPVDSLYTLRRIFTPGVVEVCLKITK